MSLSLFGISCDGEKGAEWQRKDDNSSAVSFQYNEFALLYNLGSSLYVV